MLMSGETWTQMGSVIGTLMFSYAIFQQYVPRQLLDLVHRYTQKLVGWFYPYVEITFHEYPPDTFKRSKAYAAIEMYLGANSSDRAKRLKANVVKGSKSVALSMDDNEQITDKYKGVNLLWLSSKSRPEGQTISLYPQEEVRRYYCVTFHRRHRDLVTGEYLQHVMEEGKAIALMKRQRKLYTNIKGDSWDGNGKMWSHVVFEHPATFDTLAMDPNKKREIMDDLLAFSKAKEYYAKMGKAWKRGYLLYGPPGTGKSTMIAAMANFLQYDVYDLELTAVKDNTELRKLLIDTSSKSIIVIEDIDCSLDLTGKREKSNKEKDVGEMMKDISRKKANNDDEEESRNSSKVTLSGLLNFIDGLWSACGGKRIIVFTTNHLDKLDPALIRRGRMDMRIELSYCCYEGFKLLARNYLDLESHNLFEKIGGLLGETDMTPADVAENLMPKYAGADAESCLLSLIKALEMAKEEAKRKEESKTKKGFRPRLLQFILLSKRK